MLRSVVVTGVGVVAAGLVGGHATLRRFLAAPPAPPGDHVVDDASLRALLDGADARRTSRVSRLAVAATRLALADARLDETSAAGLVLGTEHGDLHSTIEFAEGYLRAGPTGLSPLLFPNTVMNTMASATTIAVGTHGPSLTLNVRTVGGELAVARAAHTVASGRLDVVLAGGVDVRNATVEAALAQLGAGAEVRGEGATVLVLEARDHALARGASAVGEILGVAWRGLATRPNGVGCRVESRAIAGALAEAGLDAHAITWVYGSSSGDGPRDAWERGLLARALGPRVPVASLAPLFGQHAGLGALRVAAATWTAASGRLVQPAIRVPPGPGLVHGVARGGTHVALVVGEPHTRSMDERAMTSSPVSGHGASGGCAAAPGGISEPVGGVGEERRSLLPTLMIIIPAFNEAATIADVVERALGHAPVIVVDDGSTDDTAARAEAAGAEVIRHGRRLGKGQAIRAGMSAAAIHGATAVVTLDGDGQHDPADIPRLRAAAAPPGALVIGGRLGQSGGFVRGRLNAVRVAGFFVNWASGLHVEDTQSGFRLYPLPLVRELPTRRGGFVFETEVLIAAARRGLVVREVPVRTSPRTAQRSRFRPVVDGVLIGAYLAERGLGRWLVELREGFAGVRAAGVGEWWRHPRRRRVAAAAWGTALSPLLLGLAVCQSLVGTVARRLAARPAPDLVTPVVTRWFSQARLTDMTDLGGLEGPPKPPNARGTAAKPWRSSNYSDRRLDADAARRSTRVEAGAAPFATPPSVPS